MSELANAEEKAYDARLQRRLQVLKEVLEAGQLKIADGLRTIESLKAVRYLPDGTVDLSTVDGLVRSLALGVTAMHDRRELKERIPLAEIQREYFAFLEANFGEFYRSMLERGLTPHDVGRALSRNTSTIQELTQSLGGFLEVIEEFWNGAAEAAHAHVEDTSDVLKGVFGGDLFPSHNQNIASKCGIYIDTIILPDPFLRSKHLFNRGTPEQQAYYLVKHALNVLQYKELACADLTRPIVLVLPDLAEIDESEKEFCQRLGENDALAHAGRIFGRQFSSLHEMVAFARSLDTLDRAVAEVVDPTRVLFDTQWKGDLRDQIARATTDRYAKLLGTENPGIIVANQAIGRMGVCNELLLTARRLRGTPVIDAPTSWQYFVWKLEYDAGRAERELKVPDLHVVRALQSLAKNKMEWLGRVPPKALIELRKTGAIDEIRNILGGLAQTFSRDS